MKSVSLRIWIGVAAIALMALLLLQIRWMLHARSLKHRIFLEKKTMVLARVTEDVSDDDSLSHRLIVSCGPQERQQIDSLIRYYLKYYGLKSSYSFDVVYPTSQIKLAVLKNILPGTDTTACYTESLEENTDSHPWMLQLEVKEPQGNLWSSLTGPVILSAMLVCIVLFVFYKSVQRWRQEKSLLEQTRDFMNNMAHEFRTPITNISLAGKMLQRKGVDREKYLHMIQEENSRLSDQVDAILTMYSIENGSLSIKEEPIDLNEIVESAVARFSLQAAQKGGRLLCSIPEDVGPIKGDRRLLTIAIGNLIDNALKYSDTTPEVMLKVVRNGNWIELHVSDNGPGIPPAFHDKVFERYFRISHQDVHNVKGFGLGLSFAKQVVEIHKGAIVLNSGSGKGTTFILRLPYA